MQKFSQEGINKFKAEGAAPLNPNDLDGHTKKYEKEIYGLKVVQYHNPSSNHLIMTVENQLWDRGYLDNPNQIEEGFFNFSWDGIGWLLAMYPFMKEYITNV